LLVRTLLTCSPSLVAMAECEEIVALFKQHDANGDGTIDQAELTAVMSGIGFSEEDCVKMFAEVDVNQDGAIKYEEFVAWVFSEDAADAALAEESDAPFLREAFGIMTKCVTQLTMAAMEMGEGDDTSKLEAAMAEEQAMQEQFTELLGKSFDHHNKSGSGVLDAEEAKTFFNNLVSESGAFLEAIVSISCKKMGEQAVKAMVGAMSAEDPEGDPGVKMAMIGGFREGLKSGMADAKIQCAKQLEEYKANKEERDAAAFAIIDADGTGSIGKEEFLAAFTPGSEKSDQVMAALGLEPPEPEGIP